jgi:hypothetical protein
MPDNRDSEAIARQLQREATKAKLNADMQRVESLVVKMPLDMSPNQFKGDEATMRADLTAAIQELGYTRFTNKQLEAERMVIDSPQLPNAYTIDFARRVEPDENPQWHLAVWEKDSEGNVKRGQWPIKEVKGYDEKKVPGPSRWSHGDPNPNIRPITGPSSSLVLQPPVKQG